MDKVHKIQSSSWFGKASDSHLIVPTVSSVSVSSLLFRRPSHIPCASVAAISGEGQTFFKKSGNGMEVLV